MTTTEAPTGSTPAAIDIELVDDYVEPRLQARRVEVRLQQRRRRLHQVLAGVAAVVVLGLGVGVFFTPLLSVSRLDVRGTAHLATGDVVDAARVQVGDHLLTLDPEAVRRRVEQLPWVDRAMVTRRWPRSLEIKVVERQGVATVANAAGNRLVVAEGGVIAGSAQASDDRLPSVTIDPSIPVRVGNRLPSEVGDAVSAVAALPADLVPQVSGAHVAADGTLVFALKGGGEVWFGPATQVDAKFLAMSTILGGAVVRTGLARLDVRVPSAPTILRR